MNIREIVRLDTNSRLMKGIDVNVARRIMISSEISSEKGHSHAETRVKKVFSLGCFCLFLGIDYLIVI